MDTPEIQEIKVEMIKPEKIYDSKSIYKGIYPVVILQSLGNTLLM